MIIHLFCFVVSYDIWFYFSHILLHNIHLYKLIHKYHHQKDYSILQFTDNYVGHILEGPFQGVGILVPFVFMDANMYAFVSAIILINMRGMMRHDNRFIPLIGNHHILHHKYPRYNFGEYWLDKLFMTNYNKKEGCEVRF